ncbi:MAG: hypothetical protein C4527_29200 [Candidatus Omnitrophota bacterium]|jgi:hypothetical protein|nr:MAG: hypothetical protein C4527_29200 [Candidatus Omnitrophota bacterium]
MIRKKTQTGKIWFTDSVGKAKSFLLFVPLLFCVNCGTVRLHARYSGPLQPPPDFAADYAYPANWSAAPAEEQPKDCERFLIQLPDDDPSKQNPILVDYYRCEGKGKRPGILVSPILGGRNRIASHFARFFSQRGYHCIVVHRPPDLTTEIADPCQFEERLRNAVIRDRVALDWFCRQPDVSANAIGSFGVSYGGIKNVVLAGVDDRLQAHVFALAGGDLASIFVASNEKKLIRIREKLIEEHGWNLAQTEEELHRTFFTEPLRFAPFVDARKTLLFLARMDATVPRKNGELLRQKLGFPKTVYLPAGHYSAALYTGIIGLPFVEWQALGFFDAHLKTR